MSKASRILLMVLIVAAALAAWLGIDTGGGAAAGTETRQVTDSTGTEVAIPAHPQRVVILNASNVDLYLAAGGKDTLVGRCESDMFSPETAAAVKDIPSVGMIHSPNREAILAASPDLVIGADVPYNVGLRLMLDKAGIPLYINGVNSYDDVVDTLTFYGELTGRGDAAEASIAKVSAARREALARNQGRKGPKSLILFRTPQGSSAATSNSFSGEMLTLLGGSNPADGLEAEGSGYVPLSMEFVIRENPEVVFIIAMGSSEEERLRLPEELKADEVWSGISAVQNDRVHVLPSELFLGNPGVRIADAFEFMASCLYPEDAV